MSLLFFFASPPSSASLVGARQKSNPPAGGAPTNDDGPFVGNSYVHLLYYCSFGIGNSILRRIPLQR